MINIRRQNLAWLNRERRDRPFSVFDILGHEGNTMWLEADNGVLKEVPLNGDPTLAGNNDSVHYWKDKSLYGASAYSDVPSRRPIYKANQLNGLPIISFTKENQQGLTTVNQWDYNIYNQTILVIGKWYSGNGFCGKGANGPDRVNQTGANSAIHRKLNPTPYSTNLLGYQTGKDGTSCAGVIISPRTRADWNIYAVKQIRNNLTYFNINGSEQYSPDQSINISWYNQDNFGIGVAYPSIWQEFTTCDIYAVLIFSYALPNKWIRALQTHFSTKTGIPLV